MSVRERETSSLVDKGGWKESHLRAEVWHKAAKSTWWGEGVGMARNEEETYSGSPLFGIHTFVEDIQRRRHQIPPTFLVSYVTRKEKESMDIHTGRLITAVPASNCCTF